MSPKPIKIVRGYNALARYMAGIVEDGEAPRDPAIRSPYSWGPCLGAYRLGDGTRVAIYETGHRRFEVHAAPERYADPPPVVASSACAFEPHCVLQLGHGGLCSATFSGEGAP